MEEDALHILVVVMMVAMRMVVISVAMPVIMPMAMVCVSKSCEAYNIHQEAKHTDNQEFIEPL
jgi:hypothetical protein